MRANERVLVGVWVLPLGCQVIAPGERKRFAATPMINAIARTVVIMPTPGVSVCGLDFGGGEELFTGDGPVPASLFSLRKWGGLRFAHPEIKRGVSATIDLQYWGKEPAHVYACATCTPTEGVVFCWRCGASEWTDFPTPARCDVCGGKRHDGEDPEWDED